LASASRTKTQTVKCHYDATNNNNNGRKTGIRKFCGHKQTAKRKEKQKVLSRTFHAARYLQIFIFLSHSTSDFALSFEWAKEESEPSEIIM